MIPLTASDFKICFAIITECMFAAAEVICVAVTAHVPNMLSWVMLMRFLF